MPAKGNLRKEGCFHLLVIFFVLTRGLGVQFHGVEGEGGGIMRQ